MVDRLSAHKPTLSDDSTPTYDIELLKAGNLNCLIASPAGVFQTRIHEQDDEGESLLVDVTTQWVNKEMTDWENMKEEENLQKIRKEGKEKADAAQEAWTEEDEEKAKQDSKNNAFTVEEYNKEAESLKQMATCSSHEGNARFILEKAANQCKALVFTPDHICPQSGIGCEPLTKRFHEKEGSSIPYIFDCFWNDETMNIPNTISKMKTVGYAYNEVVYILWTDIAALGQGSSVRGWQIERENKRIPYLWAIQAIRLMILKLKNLYQAVTLWTNDVRILKLIQTGANLHNTHINLAQEAIAEGKKHEYKKIVEHVIPDAVILQLGKNSNVSDEKEAFRKFADNEIPVFVIGDDEWASTVEFKKLQDEITEAHNGPTHLISCAVEINENLISIEDHDKICDMVNGHICDHVGAPRKLEGMTTNGVFKYTNHLANAFSAHKPEDFTIHKDEIFKGYAKWAREGFVIDPSNGEVVRREGEWGWHIARKNEVEKYNRHAQKNAYAGATRCGGDGFITDGQVFHQVNPDWVKTGKMKVEEPADPNAKIPINYWNEHDLRVIWQEKVKKELAEKKLDVGDTKKLANEQLSGIVMLTEIKSVVGKITKGGCKIMCSGPKGVEEMIELDSAQIHNSMWKAIEVGTNILVRIDSKDDKGEKKMAYLEGVPLNNIDEENAYEIEQGECGMPTGKVGLRTHQEYINKTPYFEKMRNTKRTNANIGLAFSGNMKVEREAMLSERGYANTSPAPMQAPENPKNLEEMKQWVMFHNQKLQQEIVELRDENARQVMREEGTRSAMCRLMGAVKHLGYKDVGVQKAMQLAEDELNVSSMDPDRATMTAYQVIMDKYKQGIICEKHLKDWEAIPIVSKEATEAQTPNDKSWHKDAKEEWKTPKSYNAWKTPDQNKGNWKNEQGWKGDRQAQGNWGDTSGHGKQYESQGRQDNRKRDWDRMDRASSNIPRENRYRQAEQDHKRHQSNEGTRIGGGKLQNPMKEYKPKGKGEGKYDGKGEGKNRTFGKNKGSPKGGKGKGGKTHQ